MANGRHFNGGTITWTPLDPYTNSSPVVITITQTYSWSFPTMKCANDVPISTPGRSGENDNLNCVVDCGTDGGYSSNPIDILTDCISSSSSLGMMTSQRSRNVSLAAGAYFSVAYQGAAWRSLNYPSVTGLDWSILSTIDLRRRPDGFINTPPVATVVSPQYVIVNTTTQIQIPVLDANAGDDVRCRWAIYQPGYRRRRVVDDYEVADSVESSVNFNGYKIAEEQVAHVRAKRATLDCTHIDCLSECKEDCRCNCTVCLNTNCTEGGQETKCQTSVCSTVKTTTQTIMTTISTASTSETTTESETPGTKRSTSSFPSRQAIDECGGICHPSSTPNTTTLSSNCTLSFTGLIPDTWYAVAIQVEDFINSTSNEPLSSVPVQLLIYVQPTPKCSTPPRIEYTITCLEVELGVSKTFQATAVNLCNPSDAKISDIIASTVLPGLIASNMTRASNESFAYVTYSWTPQANQIGIQEFCAMALTTERIQSVDYCINFSVVSQGGCTTTTSTTISTTSITTTTSSSTSSSTSSTSSSTSSTSSTTSTSTSTTTTSTTSTTTETTTSTSTTSTSSTTSTTTSSTSTTTSVTTTTTTSVTITTVTTAKSPKKDINWLLIFGLSLLALSLAICCCCCCLLYYLWVVGGRRRRRKSKEEKKEQNADLFICISDRKSTNPLLTNRIPALSGSVNRISLTTPYSLLSDMNNKTPPLSKTARNSSNISIANTTTNVRVSRISHQNKPIETENLNDHILRKQMDQISLTNQSKAFVKENRSFSVCDYNPTNNSQIINELHTSNRRSTSVNVIHVPIDKLPNNIVEQTKNHFSTDVQSTQKHLKRSLSANSVKVRHVSRDQLLSKKYLTKKSELFGVHNNSFQNTRINIVKKPSS